MGADVNNAHRLNCSTSRCATTFLDGESYLRRRENKQSKSNAADKPKSADAFNACIGVKCPKRPLFILPKEKYKFQRGLYQPQCRPK